MTTVVYPGSFDPITHGHVAVIRAAAEAFGEVVVAVGVNPHKAFLFTIEERERLVKMATAGVKGVRVGRFEGLLVDYMVRSGFKDVVRGVRNSRDFEESLSQDTYGWQQALAADIRVFYVPAKSEHQMTSSTGLKVVVKQQGDAAVLAPFSSIQAVQGRLLKQYVYGVTGPSGAGKSYVCRRFAELAAARGLELVHVDLDRLGHEILQDAAEPVYAAARQRILDKFGAEVGLETGAICRKTLGDKVFGDAEAMARLNEILHGPIYFRLRERMRGKAGIFVIEAALLAESGRCDVVNNNVLVVDAGEDVRAKRIAQRGGLTPEQVRLRMGAQVGAEGKVEMVERVVEASGYGAVDRLMNEGQGVEAAIEAAFERMVERGDVLGDLGMRTL